jgi:hypothetical protein
VATTLKPDLKNLIEVMLDEIKDFERTYGALISKMVAKNVTELMTKKDRR